MKIRDKLNSNPYRKPEKIASTSERIQYLLSERGMKQSDLARATGISRGAISNYATGRYEPKSDIVQKLAEALNCSEMWLWGYDVPMGRESITYIKEEDSPYEQTLTEGELLMLELFRQIPEDRQPAALELLRAALKMQ